MDVASLIKKMAVEAVETEKPCAVMLGTIRTASPLCVDVEQKLRLTGEQLIPMKQVEVESSETPVTLKNNFLKAGDRVVLLREQNGQRFVILGVI